MVIHEKEVIVMLTNKKISRNYSKHNAVSMIKLPLNLSIAFYV